MFGISFTELIIIAVLGLVLLGPEKLPDAAKTLGKVLREVRKLAEDVKGQIDEGLYADERRANRPALVPLIPAAPVPGPAGPPPPASAENVPGLEAALAEPSTARADGPAAISPDPEPRPAPPH